MQVEIANLGAIKEAEVCLRPLTVFVGPNGSGKTWLAYALSGILSNWGWTKFHDAYVEGQLQSYKAIDEIIDTLWNEGTAKFDISAFAHEEAASFLNAVAGLVNTWLPEFMATKVVSFSEVSIQFSLLENDISTIRSRLLAKENVDQLGIGAARSRKPVITASKDPNDGVVYFYSSESLKDKLPKTAVRDFVLRNTLLLVHHAFFREVWVFPTERTTFITLPFERASLPRRKSSRTTSAGASSERNEVALIRPVANFLGIILESLYAAAGVRERNAEKSESTRRIIQLATMLEQEVLQGGVGYTKTEIGSGPLVFTFDNQQTNTSETVDIPIASSMVKELAPLVLCLRDVAQGGDLLVIDEPEMNLHPEAQVKFVEFLAMLVNAGLHLLITTHSSYVVDHLANLIKASKQERSDDLTAMFFLKQEEAFLQQHDVSVYLFESGTAKNILLEDGSIDWGTFSSVSSKIEAINMAL